MYNNNQGFNLQNNPALPYPADQLLREPQQVNIANPPFVPNNIDCPPELNQFIPTLCGNLANIISMGARNNNLRVFAFNQLSQNGFSNPEFGTLVATAIQIMAVEVYVKNRGNDVNALIQYVCNKTVEIFIAINVSRFPPLQQYLDQNQMNQINALTVEFQNYTIAANQLTQNMQAQYRPGMQQFNQPVGYGVYNQQQNQLGGGFNRFNVVNQRPNAPVGHYGSGSSGDSVFNEPIVNSPSANQISSATSRFSGLLETVHGKKEMTQTPLAQIETHQQIPVITQEKPKIYNTPVPYRDSEISWQRTDEQPYPIIAASSKEMICIIGEENKKFGHIVIKNKGENELFDYDKHTALTTLKIRPNHLPSDINDIVIEQEFVIEDISNGALNETLEYSSDDIEKSYRNISSSSVEHAILCNSVSKNIYTETTGKIPSVYVTSHRMVENIGPIDMDNFPGFGSATSFKDFREEITEGLQGPNHYAWMVVEIRITRLINKVLRTQLGLDLKISSFLEDYEDLLSILAKTSESLFRAFLGVQKYMVSQTKELVLDGDTRYSINKTFLAHLVKSEIKVANLEFLVHDAMVASLNIDAVCMDVDTYKDLGTLITKTSSPLLYLIAENLLESQENPLAHVYIVLNDLNVLLITKGLIGENNYLVSVEDK